MLGYLVKTLRVKFLDFLWQSSESSSPKLYEQLFCQFPFAKKLQTHTVSTEKVHTTLSYEKVAHKRWWNWHQYYHFPWLIIFVAVGLTIHSRCLSATVKRKTIKISSNCRSQREKGANTRNNTGLKWPNWQTKLINKIQIDIIIFWNLKNNRKIKFKKTGKVWNSRKSVLNQVWSIFTV